MQPALTAMMKRRLSGKCGAGAISSMTVISGTVDRSDGWWPEYDLLLLVGGTMPELGYPALNGRRVTDFPRAIYGGPALGRTARCI